MVLPLALSLAGQVEKYGAYAGIAAFLGLAVLSLLYFAQAREVKRLREWAGRAPERAREIEERAIAQAEAARRTPAPSPRPTSRPVPQPVGAAAPAAAGGGAPPSIDQPTVEADVLADEEEDEGGVPPATAAGAQGNGTPPPGAKPSAPADAEQENEEAEGDAGEADAEGSGTKAPGAVAAAGAAAAAAGAAAAAKPPADGDNEDAADEEDESEDESEDDDETRAQGAAKPPVPGQQPAPAKPTPNGTGSHPPAVLPAPATAASARRPTPPGPAQPQPPRRPAAAPLRAPVRSTTTPPPQSRGEGRSIVVWIVVCALAVVLLAGGAYGAIKYFTGKDGSPSQANHSTGAPSGSGDQGKQQKPKSNSTAVPADVKAQTTVSVLNGTGTTGLAAKVQGQLVAAGYEKGITQNAQGGPTTIVYYQEGSRAAARDIAKRLKTTQVKPVDPQTLAAGGAAKIVVILGQDQVR